MTRNQFATIAERDAFVVRSSDIGDRFFVRETGKTYEATAPGAGASNWSSIADLSTSAALTAAVLAAQRYMPISGLGLTWVSTTTITVATGACPDSTAAAYLENTAAKTLDMSASGALGLDTGSVAQQKVYYVWLLKGTSGYTVAASLQSAYASVTKPAGYATYGRCVGTFHTKAASSAIVTFVQSYSGNLRTYDFTDTDASKLIFGSGHTGTNVAADCSKYLPVTAKRIRIGLGLYNDAVARVVPYLATSLAQASGQTGYWDTPTLLASSSFDIVADLPVNTTPATAFYWGTGAASGGVPDGYGQAYGYTEQL